MTDYTMRRNANGSWTAYSDDDHEPVVTLLPHATLRVWSRLAQPVTYVFGHTLASMAGADAELLP